MQRLLIATDASCGDVRPLVQAALGLDLTDQAEVVLVYAIAPTQAARGPYAAESALDELEAELCAEGVQVSGTRVLRVCPLDELVGASTRELGAKGLVLGASEAAGPAVRSAGAPCFVVGPRWRLGLPLRLEDVRHDPPLLRWRRVRETLATLGPSEASVVFSNPELPGPQDCPWSRLVPWSLTASAG